MFILKMLYHSRRGLQSGIFRNPHRLLNPTDDAASAGISVAVSGTARRATTFLRLCPCERRT
jgi:hypothetical protein